MSGAFAVLIQLATSEANSSVYGTVSAEALDADATSAAPNAKDNILFICLLPSMRACRPFPGFGWLARVEAGEHLLAVAGSRVGSA